MTPGIDAQNNTLVSTDNKGMAAYLYECLFDQSPNSRLFIDYDFD